MGWWGALRASVNGELLVALAVGMGIAVVIVGLLVWRRVPKPMAYFKTKDGKNALVGLFGAVPLLYGLCGALVVILVTLAFLFAPLSANAQTVPTSTIFPGTWLNDASLYMGLDHPRKQSAQCESGGMDDRSTSNMGLRMNLWESTNERVRVNAKYTHHSCVLNRDRNTTDAIGLEVEVKLWCRKCK